MKSLPRLAPRLAAIGGLAYLIEGAITLYAPQPDRNWSASGYAIEAAFALALLATIGLIPLLAANASRAARLGARVTQAGFAAMLVSSLASLPAGRSELGPLFLIGVLATLAGLAATTALALRRGRARSWTTPAVLAGLVVAIALGDHGGGIALGAAWLAVCTDLRRPSRRAGLVAATAGVALTAVALLAGAAFRTATAQAAAATTIVLDARQVATHFVDNAPKGESPGDTISFTDTLRQHGKNVGFAEVTGTLVDHQRDADQLQGTIHLAAGDIVIAGISLGQAADQTFAIIGGTGRYATSRGSVTIHTGAHTTITLHLS